MPRNEKQPLLGGSSSKNVHEDNTESGDQKQINIIASEPISNKAAASTDTAIQTSTPVALEDSTRSRNVFLMMLYNFLDGAAFSVWQYQVLQVLLYNVAGESNTIVGLVSGASGLAQVVSAAVAGYAGDVLKKKYLTRSSAVVGLIAAITTLYAVYSRSLVMYFTSSAFWGFYGGFSNPSSEALFADSISSGKRTGIYTRKYVVQILCYLVGYAVNIGLFLRFGDEWGDDTLEIVMYIGVALHPLAFIPLSLLSDRYSLKNMLAAAAANNSGEEDEGEDEDEDEYNKQKGEETKLIGNGGAGDAHNKSGRRSRTSSRAPSQRSGQSARSRRANSHGVYGGSCGGGVYTVATAGGPAGVGTIQYCEDAQFFGSHRSRTPPSNSVSARSLLLDGGVKSNHFVGGVGGAGNRSFGSSPSMSPALSFASSSRRSHHLFSNTNNNNSGRVVTAAAQLQVAVDTFYATVSTHEKQKVLPVQSRDPSAMLILGGYASVGGEGQTYYSAAMSATEPTRETVVAGAALEAADAINNANKLMMAAVAQKGGGSARGGKSTNNDDYRHVSISSDHQHQNVSISSKSDAEGGIQNEKKNNNGTNTHITAAATTGIISIIGNNDDDDTNNNNHNNSKGSFSSVAEAARMASAALSRAKVATSSRMRSLSTRSNQSAGTGGGGGVVGDFSSKNYLPPHHPSSQSERETEETINNTKATASLLLLSEADDKNTAHLQVSREADDNINNNNDYNYHTHYDMHYNGDGGATNAVVDKVRGATVIAAVLALNERDSSPTAGVNTSSASAHHSTNRGGSKRSKAANLNNNNNNTTKSDDLIWQSTRGAAEAVLLARNSELEGNDQQGDDSIHQVETAAAAEGTAVVRVSEPSPSPSSTPPPLTADAVAATNTNNTVNTSAAPPHTVAIAKGVVDLIVKPSAGSTSTVPIPAPIANHTPLEKVEYYYQYRARVLRRRQGRGGAADSHNPSHDNGPNNNHWSVRALFGGLSSRAGNTQAHSSRGGSKGAKNNASNKNKNNKHKMLLNVDSSDNINYYSTNNSNGGTKYDGMNSDATGVSRETMGTFYPFVDGEEAGYNNTNHNSSNEKRASPPSSSNPHHRGGHHPHHHHNDTEDASRRSSTTTSDMSDVESLFGDEDNEGIFNSSTDAATDATTATTANNVASSPHSLTATATYASAAASPSSTTTGRPSLGNNNDSNNSHLQGGSASGPASPTTPVAVPTTRSTMPYRPSAFEEKTEEEDAEKNNANKKKIKPKKGKKGNGNSNSSALLSVEGGRGRNDGAKKGNVVEEEEEDLLHDEEAVYSRLTSGIDLIRIRNTAKTSSTGNDGAATTKEAPTTVGVAVPAVGVYDSESDSDKPLGGYSSCLCCPSQSACYQPELRWYENYNIVPHLVVAADFIQAVGSGMTVRFLTLFFVKDFDLKPIVITVTFIIITILSALIAQVMSRIAARMQRLPLIIAVRLTGTTALFLMAILPEIDKGNADNFLHSIYLLLVIFVIRQGCMNSTMGISRAVVMDFVKPSDRAKWSSMESFASFTWAGSAAVGGIIADASGYGATFLVTAGLHYFACFLMIPAALAGRRLERIVLAMNAKDRAAKAEKAALLKQIKHHEQAALERERELRKRAKTSSLQ